MYPLLCDRSRCRHFEQHRTIFYIGKKPHEYKAQSDSFALIFETMVCESWGFCKWRLQFVRIRLV